MEAAVTIHAALTRQFLKWDSELNRRCNSGTLADRFNHLIEFWDEQPDYRLDGQSLLSDAIVEWAVTVLPPPRVGVPWGKPPAARPYVEAFHRALDLDGFTVADGVLHRALPDDLDLPQAEDDVTRLLTKHSFVTPKGHLDQALEAHARGEWASANAQLRTFFEGLLDEMAISLDTTAANLPSSENRRAKLASLGFLIVPLNDWSDDGKNFINGLWKRLHPSGSHPGLSDQTDSTFRRHIVLLTAGLLLARFDAREGP